MKFRRAVRDLAAAAALIALTACGSDPGDGGNGPGEQPAIAISVSKTALTAQQGGSDQLTATITRSGGFTGTVNVVTEGAPAGVTAAVSNVSTTNGTTTGTVTVSVAATVPVGTYNLTVKASGSGVADKTVALTLTVTAPPAIGVALAAATSTIDQGASGTVGVTINRTNFTGNVTLALEGVPAGVTGTFNPNATGTNASTLTIQVGGAVTPGNYNLTVRATGTGVTDATAPLQLTVNAPSSFGIASVTPDPFILEQGDDADATVTLTRSNFAGAINLTLEGAPAGVTHQFNPASPAGAVTTAALAITVGDAVTPGDYTLTVKAAATGQTDKTRTFVLRVTARGNYALTTTPATQVSLQQGNNTNVTVNVDRTGGFVGPVALTVTGAPGGLTAQLNPTSTTGNTSTLALTAAGNLAPGAYPLVIKGTTTGLPDKTVNFTVNVTAPQTGGNVTLDYSGCSIDEKPTWVAYQDGTGGTWTRVVGTADVYSFDITQPKAGLAVVTTPQSGGASIAVQYYSQAEITALATGEFCPPEVVGKTLIATTSNLSALQLANVSIGGSTGTASMAQPNATILNVPDGTFDLIGYAAGIGGLGTADRVFVRRDVNTAPIAGGGSVGPVLDFTGSESAAAASGSMTLTNLLGGDQVIHSMSYLTGAACTSSLLYALGQVSGATFTAYGVPAAKQRGTDYHNLNLFAGNGTSVFRSVIETFQAMGNRTIDLPTVIAAFTPTSVAGPYKRLRFQYNLASDINTSTTAQYIEDATSRGVSIMASQAFLGGNAVDLSMPDFSAVAGWNNAWAPTSAGSVDWTATGAGGSLTAFCANGKFSSSTRGGSI